MRKGTVQKALECSLFIYKLGVWATRADARRRLPVHMVLLVIIWKTLGYWLSDG